MIEADLLVGTWQLQSWVVAQEGRERLTHPFGLHPEGLLVYTPDRWMTASISRRQRQLLPSDRPYRSIEPEQMAEAFTSYFHYAGRYRMAGDSVIHSVTQSLNPNFPGTEQVRKVDLLGDSLVLSGVEDAGGVRRVHTLTWMRATA